MILKGILKTFDSTYTRSRIIHSSKRLSSTTTGAQNSNIKKLEDFFFNDEVQSLLKRITGLDYEKIFQPRHENFAAPKYEFVTDKRLKELQDGAKVKAEAKLQMPPVMDIREPIDVILSKDPELQGFEESKIVFTDISEDISSRDRMITVRELDGTLRKANWEERFRMNQIFFPIEGRSILVPKLFDSPHLDHLLDEGSYNFILDVACVQFEPDDPEYHRVTHAVYEHICSKKQFDVLRSTRHFGPMALYFAHQKHIEPLLVDMIMRKLLTDAYDMVRLLQILHPDDVKQTLDKDNELEAIQDFIQTNESSQKANLELAIQTFLEIQENNEKKQQSVE